MRGRGVILSLILGWAPQAISSVPRPLLEEALKLPIENRIQAISAQGVESLETLEALVFDESKSLSVRWRALTTLARLSARRAQPLVEKALHSSEWYLRNAAVVSLPSLDKAFALKWSEKMVSDPALVVRTSAVQNLLKLGSRASEELLWQKLSAQENFHKGQSLWIRRHIARTLAEFARPGQESKYIQMLHDKDQRLHPFGVRALHKITGHRPDSPQDSISASRDKWIAWWGSKNL